ncbi:MAG: hypothetical protein ACETWM_14350 [Candidatus Lokiarchaeia archaeon]
MIHRFHAYKAAKSPCNPKTSTKKLVEHLATSGGLLKAPTLKNALRKAINKMRTNKNV